MNGSMRYLGMGMPANWRDGPDAAKWIPVISTAEINNGIPTGLSSRQCYQESRFIDSARNPISGAIGLFQLLPQFFSGAGSNPVKDIGTATAYLASLSKRFGGDWQLGLAAYDFGPGNLSKWQKSQGTFATLPIETRNYVTQIVADVPVPGVLCKVQSQTSLPTGSPPISSSAVPSSVKQPHKSLWQSVTGIFTRHSAQNSPALSLPSATQQPPTSLKIPHLTPKDSSMSTPVPVPTLTAGQKFFQLLLQDVLSTGGTPLLTFLASFGAAAGDPVKIEAAFVALTGAEVGQLGPFEALISGQISAALITKVQAAMTLKT
jgi:transglycosylase-like protein with SLT domain